MSRAMEKMTTSSMPPSASSEQLRKIDETLRVLIDTLMNQSERLTAIEKTLNKQSETLSTLAETVSDKRVVKTCDGSSVSASELQAHSMMKQLSSDLTKTTSALGELTAQVKAKSHVSLNAEKVAEVMSRRVTQHFDHAVQEPVEGLRSDLQGLRKEMSTLGTERLSEVFRS